MIRRLIRGSLAYATAPFCLSVSPAVCAAAQSGQFGAFELFDQGTLHIVERVNHLLGFDHLGQGR